MNGHANCNMAKDDLLTLARGQAVPNRVKDKLQAGQLAHAFSIKMVNNVEVVGFAAIVGFDAILIDLEHSSFGLKEANQLSCMALQSGVTPIVRVPANTSDWISRCLDGGAQAVIVPHVNSAAEAEHVVQCARFAPLGERSATLGMPALRYAAVAPRYANQVANEATLVICMIETERALKNVKDIAAVQGVDVLLIGSADLTQDMGIPSEFDHPRLMDAYDQVAAACKSASADGRFVSMGIGGLNGRPDLLEKVVHKHACARFAMSGADNGLLLGAMRQAAAKWQAMSEAL